MTGCDWREENRGDTTAEDQLWLAAAAVSELDAALNSPGGGHTLW